MIQTVNEEIKYKTIFSNSKHSAYADTTPDKGGSSSGFRPHELLEAAIASCMNMQIRMYADNHNVDVSGINVVVTLDRSNPDSAIFEYKINLEGNLSEDEKEKLIKIAESCPVKKTLGKKIDFRSVK